MSGRLRKLLLVMLILFNVISIQADDIATPVGQSLYDLEYRLKYNSVLSNGDVSLLPPIGPYRISAMSQPQTPAMRLLTSVDDSHLRLIGLANNRYHVTSKASPNHYYSFTGGVRYTLSDNFGLLSLYKMDREQAQDPDYVGHQWRGVAAQVEIAAFYYTQPTFKITFGRQRLFWGPQPVNLLLSSTALPLDQFSVQYHKGRLSFGSLFASLDDSRPDLVDYQRFPDATFTENRYIAAHRLDLRVHKRFRIGLSEISLFGGEGRSPELYYLNPLHFFHSTQLNEQLDDNSIFGIDFIWLPGWRSGLYGQLLIDDLQVDDESAGDQEPNEIGLMAGFQRAGEIGSWLPDLKIEYVKITNRTYHQRQPRNRYLHRNHLLGHPLGPDADSLSVKLTLRPEATQFVECEFGVKRHGEGSIYSPWDEPWLESIGDYQEAFPTGVVERTSFIALRGGGYLSLGDYCENHLYLAFAVGFESYDNWDNIAGKSNTNSWFHFGLTWFGSMDLDLGD